MSFPSSQPPTPSHEMPARRSSGEYTRLPLDSKPVGPPGGVTRPRRARASTLGGGLKLPTMDALETPEMREKHVNEAFGRLLVSFVGVQVENVPVDLVLPGPGHHATTRSYRPE